MQRPSFILTIFVSMLLMADCANAQLQELKTMEDHSTPTVEPTSTAVIETKSKVPPKSCPVTLGDQHTFQAPEPYSPATPWEGFFWYGSGNLWTALRTDGVWADLPLNPEGYTQKIMWWSDLFVLKEELQPALIVTGKRLDVDAPPLGFYGATNAFASDIGDAMLTGVDFPTLGCWKITGQYKKIELSFVVWLAP